MGKFLVVWRNVWLFSQASFISLSEERKSCSLASWLNPNANSLSNIILNKKGHLQKNIPFRKSFIFDAILIFVDYFVVIHRLHRVFLVQNGTTRPNAFQLTYRPLKDNLEVINQYTFTQ